MTEVNFAVALDDKTLRVSPDGLTWATSSLTYVGPPGPIGYSPDDQAFLVFESGGQAIRRVARADGAITTLAGTSGADAVAYTNGIWVSLARDASSTVSRSTDGGVTWSNLGDKGLYPRNTSPRGGFRAANGVFLASQFDANSTIRGTHVMRSTDGITWSDRGVVAGAAIRDFVYIPATGAWLLIDDGGRVYKSTDNGLTWALVASGIPTSGLAYGDGRLVAVGNNIATRYSTDGGTTWATFGSLNVSDSSADAVDVAFYNGRFVATENASYPVVSKASNATTTVAWTIEINAGPHGIGGGLTAAYVTNLPPNAPIPTSPANNAAANRANPIPLVATFSDPDPGDSPSASQWRYRIRDIGAAWTTVTQNNTLQSYSIPAGATAGAYEWQAAYADQQGVWGPFCSSAFFTAGDPPPGPVWLDPLDGQTIGLDTYTGVISQASLTESSWTLYADNAGTMSSTILQGPVSVTTGDLRRHTFTGLANNTPAWWSVTTKDAGLWSPVVSIRTPVAYTPPAAPVVTATPNNADGNLTVGITNPAPGAGEPAAAYNNVWIDDGDGKGEIRKATLLPTNTPWVYWKPVGGRDYAGQIRVEVVAVNGTTSEAFAT